MMNNGSSPRVRGTAAQRLEPLPLQRFIPACAGNGSRPSCTAQHRTVHPRVCGERTVRYTANARFNGSSPRVRGTGTTAPSTSAPSGFIPACAGNGRRRGPRRPSPPVHPRVCGERDARGPGGRAVPGSSPRVRGTARPDNSSLPLTPVHPRVCGERVWRTFSALSRAGSSPRVRGTADAAPVAEIAERFIPACAGNGPAAPLAADPAPVHPRVCGERAPGLSLALIEGGSSPRVRGTARASAPGRAGRWFIPACAGNGDCGLARGRDWTVHPRVCGERASSAADAARPFGSSPRVRGTDLPDGAARDARRFIPACAGNGREGAAHPAVDPVHPRVCGERLGVDPRQIRVDGSSPRVRGTGAGRGQRAARARFIPACAGNGGSTLAGRTSTTVHPRVCGERVRPLPRCWAGHGSSPRVRGTALARVRVDGPRRFIPACAGNGSWSAAARSTGPVHPRVCGEREHYARACSH